MAALTAQVTALTANLERARQEGEMRDRIQTLGPQYVDAAQPVLKRMDEDSWLRFKKQWMEYRLRGGNKPMAQLVTPETLKMLSTATRMQLETLTDEEVTRALDALHRGSMSQERKLAELRKLRMAPREAPDWEAFSWYFAKFLERAEYLGVTDMDDKEVVKAFRSGIQPEVLLKALVPGARGRARDSAPILSVNEIGEQLMQKCIDVAGMAAEVALYAPKGVRLRQQGDTPGSRKGAPYHCYLCQEEGHTRKNCPNRGKNDRHKQPHKESSRGRASSATSTSSGVPSSRPAGACHNCGSTDHWARDCPKSSKKRKEASHFARGPRDNKKSRRDGTGSASGPSPSPTF